MGSNERPTVQFSQLVRKLSEVEGIMPPNFVQQAAAAEAATAAVAEELQQQQQQQQQCLAESSSIDEGVEIADHQLMQQQQQQQLQHFHSHGMQQVR